MAIGYLYTGGPIPISWTPFGELFSGLFMGMIIILLSFFIQTGNVQGYAVWLSIPIVITIGLINMVTIFVTVLKTRLAVEKLCLYF